ncbi:MAG: hypothetical protein EBS30_15290 [Planctomycetes bacterium]|nr:hypothetical protein [Planctomycetota bacterium]
MAVVREKKLVQKNMCAPRLLSLSVFCSLRAGGWEKKWDIKKCVRVSFLSWDDGGCEKGHEPFHRNIL